MEVVLGQEDVGTGKEAIDSERMEVELLSCSKGAGQGPLDSCLRERCVCGVWSRLRLGTCEDKVKWSRFRGEPTQRSRGGAGRGQTSLRGLTE